MLSPLASSAVTASGGQSIPQGSNVSKAQRGQRDRTQIRDPQSACQDPSPSFGVGLGYCMVCWFEMLRPFYFGLGGLTVGRLREREKVVPSKLLPVPFSSAMGIVWGGDSMSSNPS